MKDEIAALEIIEGIVSQAKILVNEGVDIDVKTDAWAGTALIKTDNDGTRHYKSTGERTFNIKITVMDYIPL